MKTFEERAREWLDIQDEELVATISFRVLLVMFARMLDQEAQEKCCVLCDGKDCGHLHHQDKPQQPEKIEILSWYSDVKVTQAIITKINELVDALNRLTHKD